MSDEREYEFSQAERATEKKERENRALAALMQKHTKQRRALYDLFHQTAPICRGTYNDDLDKLYDEIEELLK